MGAGQDRIKHTRSVKLRSLVYKAFCKKVSLKKQAGWDIPHPAKINRTFSGQQECPVMVIMNGDSTMSSGNSPIRISC